MFKVAPGRPGGAGAGMSRETGPARRAAANKLDMSHSPPLLPSPQFSPSQPGPAPDSDLTTQFSAAFPSKELVVNVRVRMSRKTAT